MHKDPPTHATFFKNTGFNDIKCEGDALKVMHCKSKNICFEVTDTEATPPSGNLQLEGKNSLTSGMENKDNDDDSGVHFLST